MTPARLRTIRRVAQSAGPAKLHDLYMEVYGADYSGHVTDERARASLAEAVEECLNIGKKEGHNVPDPETQDPGSSNVDVADLMGEPAVEVQPQEASETSSDTQPSPEEGEKMAEKKPKKAKAKAAPKKATKPKAEKKLTILLENPDVKRDKTGKIISITGTCGWKGCSKTRTIHAADAHQVKFCKEHTIENRKEQRRLKRKGKA